MKNLLTTISLAATFLFVTGCGDNHSFNGNAGKAPAMDDSDQNGAKNPATDENQTKMDDFLKDFGRQDPKNQAIVNCLQKFGSSPFTIDQIKNFRQIYASVQVLSSGPAIVDDEATSEPALILVNASVNVLSKTTYELLNPNGWYCLNVGVNVENETLVHLQCTAHLADSLVKVDVGSNSDPNSQVGVNVLSNVKVEKVGKCY